MYTFYYIRWLFLKLLYHIQMIVSEEYFSYYIHGQNILMTWSELLCFIPHETQQLVLVSSSNMRIMVVIKKIYCKQHEIIVWFNTNATKPWQIGNAINLNHQYLHNSDLLCRCFCFHYIWIRQINIFDNVIDACLYKEVRKEKNKRISSTRPEMGNL